MSALKLVVLDAVGGHLAYCDPDQYPVARLDPLAAAQARFPLIKADGAAFAAILAHEHLSADQHITSAELIAINTDYKQMQAIDLTKAAGGYGFDVRVPQAGSDVGVWRLQGTVTPQGRVTISRREVASRPICPICLAAGDLIATPIGPIPIQDVRVGMPVWTTDLKGRRIAAVVVETGNMQAPIGHELVKLSLADGRTVAASPGHPTADGRPIGALEPGDHYDGSVVVTAGLIPYQGTTWDLLPSGPTATYFANGILLGSTLGQRSAD